MLSIGSAGLMYNGMIFVMEDLFLDWTEADRQMVTDYIAVHEYGESVFRNFGKHHDASLLEFAIAAEEGNLERYLELLEGAYLLKFRDIAMHRMKGVLVAKIKDMIGEPEEEDEAPDETKDTGQEVEAPAPALNDEEAASTQMARQYRYSFRWPAELYARYSDALNEEEEIAREKVKDWAERIIVNEQARSYLNEASKEAQAAGIRVVQMGGNPQAAALEAKIAFFGALSPFGREVEEVFERDHIEDIIFERAATRAVENISTGLASAMREAGKDYDVIQAFVSEFGRELKIPTKTGEVFVLLELENKILSDAKIDKPEPPDPELRRLAEDKAEHPSTRKINARDYAQQVREWETYNSLLSVVRGELWRSGGDVLTQGMWRANVAVRVWGIINGAVGEIAALYESISRNELRTQEFEHDFSVVPFGIHLLHALAQHPEEMQVVGNVPLQRLIDFRLRQMRNDFTTRGMRPPEASFNVAEMRQRYADSFIFYKRDYGSLSAYYFNRLRVMFAAGKRKKAFDSFYIGTDVTRRVADEIRGAEEEGLITGEMAVYFLTEHFKAGGKHPLNVGARLAGIPYAVFRYGLNANDVKLLGDDTILASPNGDWPSLLKVAVQLDEPFGPDVADNEERFRVLDRAFLGSNASAHLAMYTKGDLADLVRRIEAQGVEEVKKQTSEALAARGLTPTALTKQRNVINAVFSSPIGEAYVTNLIDDAYYEEETSRGVLRNIEETLLLDTLQKASVIAMKDKTLFERDNKEALVSLFFGLDNLMRIEIAKFMSKTGHEEDAEKLLNKKGVRERLASLVDAAHEYKGSWDDVALYMNALISRDVKRREEKVSEGAAQLLARSGLPSIEKLAKSDLETKLRRGIDKYGEMSTHEKERRNAASLAGKYKTLTTYEHYQKIIETIRKRIEKGDVTAFADLIKLDDELMALSQRATDATPDAVRDQIQYNLNLAGSPYLLNALFAPHIKFSDGEALIRAFDEWYAHRQGHVQTRQIGFPEPYWRGALELAKIRVAGLAGIRFTSQRQIRDYLGSENLYYLNVSRQNYHREELTFYQTLVNLPLTDPSEDGKDRGGGSSSPVPSPATGRGPAPAPAGGNTTASSTPTTSPFPLPRWERVRERAEATVLFGYFPDFTGHLKDGHATSCPPFANCAPNENGGLDAAQIRHLQKQSAAEAAQNSGEIFIGAPVNAGVPAFAP